MNFHSEISHNKPVLVSDCMFLYTVSYWFVTGITLQINDTIPHNSYTNIDTLSFSEKKASGSLFFLLVYVRAVPDARNTCRRLWVNGGAGEWGGLLLPVSDRRGGGLIEVCMG